MKKALLIIVLLAGLLFRLGGIFHGVDEGEIYHPDTPKQVHAIERFLDGRLYIHIGLSDYDGYPLFVSYLTALVVRAGGFVVSPLLSLMGVVDADTGPSTLALYSIMRLLNVLLATLAIYVAWRIGRENFGEGAGLVAAIFLALSPADIAACHYASGDTGAAVFGLVSVLFALRIHRLGRWRDYILAGFFASLAFASKYHALVVFGAAGLAHLLRPEFIGRWHKGASIARLAVLGAAAVAGLWFAIPGLRVEPVAMIADIRHFMHYAANFGLPPELQDAGFFGKLLFSLQRNIPILSGLLSVPAALGSLLMVPRVRRDPRVAVLLVAPVAYFCVGVSLRPFAHPVYHTILTTPVFLLAAVAMARPFSADAGPRVWPRYAAMAAFAVSCVLLGHAAYREVYFFRHDDTRRISREWAEENLPDRFIQLPVRYTFESPRFPREHGPETMGLFYFSPSLRAARTREDCLPWFSFGVERDALPFFRNPGMTVWLHKLSAVAPDARMPVFQRTPSQAGDEYLVLDMPEFYRSPRLFEINAGRHVKRAVVSSQPLSNAVVCIAAGDASSRVDLQLGGQRRTVKLAADTSTNIVFDSLRTVLPWGTGYHHYRFRAAARHGGVRVSIAFNAQDAGIDLLQHGMPAPAAPLLRDAALEDRNPTLAALALAAAGDALPPAAREPLRQLAAPCADPPPDPRFFDVWHITTNYLARIPYREWDAAHMRFEGYHRQDYALHASGEGTELISDHKSPARGLYVDDVWLEPGCYTARLRIRALVGRDVTGNVQITFLNGHSTTTNSVLTMPVQLAAGQPHTDYSAAFRMTRLYRNGTLRIDPPPGAGVSIDAFEIRPDPAATLRALARDTAVPPPGHDTP